MLKPRFHDFTPDVIVEVTSVCDRKCVGCYAPNIVTKEAPEDLIKKFPDLYLSPQQLESSLALISGGSEVFITIRGGEPSRHPLLGDLVEVARKYGRKTYIETHGQWIDDRSEDSSALLEKIARANIFVKLSFDRMHGMSVERLQTITNILGGLGIQWVVAITERNASDFEVVRATCDFVPDDRIIIQIKAVHSNELFRPRLGVINTRGRFVPTLTNRLPNRSALEVANEF